MMTMMITWRDLNCLRELAPGKLFGGVIARNRGEDSSFHGVAHFYTGCVQKCATTKRAGWRRSRHPPEAHPSAAIGLGSGKIWGTRELKVRM